MSLPEACIRRPVMTTLLMISFVIVGIFGFETLPVAALPRIDFPTISITANFPGASPETMASSVASPLERQFSTIAGISSMVSSSAQGISNITIQFDLGRSIDGAALDVQSALTVAQRRLPIEMTTPPSFQKVNPADFPILFLSLSSDTLPLSQVDEDAETLIGQRISTLSGVAQVLIFGQQKYATRIQVDPTTLAAAGMSITDIQKSVAAWSSSTPVGTLGTGPMQSYTLQATGQPTNAAQFAKLIVAYRNGNPVRLSDVAKAEDSVQNDLVGSWFNGKPSILLAIQRQPDANTVEVVDSVKRLLPVFRAEIPAAVAIQVLIDRSVSIRHSVADVEFTLMLTMGLVILVIFLFLRNVTATLIPAIALPISVVGTFAGMYVMGYSIDNLSLLALTLSVGFVVDDAIVMLENIVRYVEMGDTPLEAALKGSREIAFTILSITLSLVAVFIPVLFMGGVVGRLFREFAVTISMTILVSGFVSLTLTPLLCSRFLRSLPHGQEQNVVFRVFEAGFDATLRGYGATLAIVLRAKRLMLLVIAASLALTLYLFAVIPKGFFPIEDTGMLYVTTEAAQDISFAAMVDRQKLVSQIFQDDPAVEVVNSSVGAGGGSNSINSGRLFVGLKDINQRKVGITQVVQRLRPKLTQIPGINVFMQPIQNIQVGGRLSKSQYQYTVQGTDLDQLNDMAPQLERRIRALSGFQDVTSDLQINSPQAFIDVDREKAATLRVPMDEIRNTLYGAFGSRQIATIYTPTNDYEVILEVDPRFQQDPNALSQIYVRSSAGSLVPLNAFSSLRKFAGPLSINHQSNLPSVTISFNLAPGVSLGDAVERIHGVELQMNLPATISTGFQGTAQVFQDSLKGQGLLLLAAIFVIYVVLGILYESFVHPVTILSGLPTAGLGALLTLLVFHVDLSVIAIIGIVMLIGIVKKNAIMMVDFALERRKTPGVTVEEAIYDACMMRYRPIMMTTMAAIMGTLPIAVGAGAGSELRQPLGLAVVGGLCVSQILTLFITPVVYIYLEQLRTRFSRGRRSAPALAAIGDREVMLPAAE